MLSAPNRELSTATSAAEGSTTVNSSMPVRTLGPDPMMRTLRTEQRRFPRYPLLGGQEELQSVRRGNEAQRSLGRQGLETAHDVVSERGEEDGDVRAAVAHHQTAVGARMLCVPVGIDVAGECHRHAPRRPPEPVGQSGEGLDRVHCHFESRSHTVSLPALKTPGSPSTWDPGPKPPPQATSSPSSANGAPAWSRTTGSPGPPQRCSG